MGESLVRINFLVNEVAGGWEPTNTRLGGTEESVVRWAEELAERGHEISVYKNGQTFLSETILPSGKYVNYYDRSLYGGHPVADICINIKSSEIPPKEPTLYLTNETNATDLDLSAYDGVIWPSQWADDHIPVNNPVRYILPHGYDSKLHYPERKIPKQCLYASSPDRGLDTLLGAWKKIYKYHPDATLLVTYGATGPTIPGVFYLGDVDEETLAELYRTSDLWCHPASGGELFGITGIKAQSSGAVPVIIPTMALSETVKEGFFAENEKVYADTLLHALNSPDTVSEYRAKLAKIRFPDWSKTADQLLQIIQNVVK